MLDQLLTSTDPNVRQIANTHDWYIFPVVNPDGYVYTHTTVIFLYAYIGNFLIFSF